MTTKKNTVNWNDLNDINTDVEPISQDVEPIDEEIEPTQKPSKSQKSKGGSKPKSEKSNPKPTKTTILDESELWKVLVRHQSEFGFPQLTDLLAKQKKNVVLDENKVGFTRTPAASAIIKIFRILNQEGFQ